MSGIVTFIRTAKTGKDVVIGTAKLLTMAGDLLCAAQTLSDVHEEYKSRKKVDEDED